LSARFSGLIAICALLLGCTTVEFEEETLECPPSQPVPLADVNLSEETESTVQERVHSGSRRLQRIAKQTRTSSVEIRINNVRGSGNYFYYNHHHIIITAAHVVNGSEVVEVITPSGEKQNALLVLFDNRLPNDVAVLVLHEPLRSRTPMNLNIREDTANLVGVQLIYTGNPGSHRLMTIFGNVSGFEVDGSIIMHAYAWGGASGSGVFDDRGKLVGILKAVDMNRNRYSPYPQVTEDIVWLAPAAKIDLPTLDALLKMYDLIVELHERGGM